MIDSGQDAFTFWQGPDHFAYWFQGHYGAGEGCIPVRMLDGFPLGSCLAESSEDDVTTAQELFGRG